MTENPTYTRVITQTFTLKDIYGSWATPQKLTPFGYVAVDFRCAKKGEQAITIDDFSAHTVDCDSNSPRLIVEKLPEPIIFNPSIFGAEATKLYGTDNIMLNVGYCLYGFMPKLSVGRNDVWALSPTFKNMCPKVEITGIGYNLIWIYKES